MAGRLGIRAGRGGALVAVFLGWLASLAPLTCASRGAPADAPSLADDAAYRALAERNFEGADAASAALLNAVDPHDRGARARALRARLVVLFERHRLGQPPGAELEAQIKAFAAEGAADEASGLAYLFTAYANLPAAAGAAPAAMKSNESLRAEKGFLDFEIAYYADHLDGAVRIAPAALAQWHALPGLDARWHEYVIATDEGRSQARLGDNKGAIASFAAAAQLAAAAFGADSTPRLDADSGRAEALERLGDYREGLAVREEILERARRRYDDKQTQTAEAEAGVGAVLQEMGDYPAARKHFEAAESVLAHVPNAQKQTRVIIANNFANVLTDMGDYEGAIARFRVALDQLADHQHEHHRAKVLGNLAEVESLQGLHAQAGADFATALGVLEQADGKDSPELVSALAGMCTSALLAHAFADAETYARRGIAVLVPHVGPEHPQLTEFHYYIALARWGQGDIAGAFAEAQTAAQHAQTALSAIASVYSEKQSITLRKRFVPATALLVTLAAQRGDAAGIAAAWQQAMIDRGLVARAQAQRLAALHTASDPRVARALADWREASAALADAWQRTDVGAAQLGALRAAVDRAQQKALAGSTHAREVPTAVARIADLAQALPADGVLVAVTEAFAALPDSRHGIDAPDEWYAFVLGRDATPGLVRLGRERTIADDIGRWYDDLRDPGSAAASLSRHGAAVREALLDPLGVLARPHHLFFVPQGDLYRINLAALPTNRGYAVESGLRVQVLGSERELVQPPRTASPRRRIVLAGAPQLAGAGAATRQLCRLALSNTLPRLPQAERELDALARVLASLSAGIDVVKGARATKAHVMDALPGASVIHIATHGFSFEPDCVEGGGARNLTLRNLSAATAEIDTQPASGLAFAQGQTGAPELMTAADIASLDLSKAEWVALSACDSGVGPIDASEGVFGMRRALGLAGARTVVMSLWQVDDAATADFMVALYRARFVDGDDVPDAMAAAMQAQLASQRAHGKSEHPYYWAGFVSEGAWR